MRLTTFTDYSLRVLIYLALNPDRRATIGEIATAFEISEHHLTKVVHFLGKHHLLLNVRGKGGGMALARRPQAINVGDVVRLTEANSVPAECFARDSNRCVITPACRLRHVLSEAIEAFHSTLRRYTLADLVDEPRALVRLLPIPASPREIVLRKMDIPKRRRAGAAARR